MPKGWIEIEKEVKDKQIMKISMEDLRDAISADRLGTKIIDKIRSELRTRNISFFPDLSNNYQDIVYLFKGEVNDLVGMVRDHCETHFKKALNEVVGTVTNNIKTVPKLPWP